MKLNTMRVYVTENCNAKCRNCFNAGTRSNTEVSTDKFERLCGYLNENGIKSLKIMGGEPTVHKEFTEIIAIAQRYFDTVRIFSNGINNELLKITLRENDSIIYNFNFANILSKEKFLLKQPGSRHLEVQVNRETDEFILMENIIEKASFDKSKINVSLTLDCISNIFIDRKLVIPKMLYLQGEIIKNGIKYGYDHKIPYCYIYKSGLKMRKNSCSCFINTSGLIDADLNLRFCNQHQKKLIQIMQEGRFLPWRILENYLIHNYYKLQMTALDKICLECVFFDNVCNGGCWITKEIISREDVINYSDFPKI